MKLTGKILLLLMLVVVLIAGVAGVLSVRTAYHNLEEKQQALAEQVTQEIEDRLATAWIAAGPRGVNAALHDWVEQTNRPLLVRWVLFATDVESEWRPKAPRDLWPVIVRGQIVSCVTTDSDKTRNLHTYLRTRPFAGEPSALELTQPLAALDEQSRHLVYASLLAIGTSALVGLGLAYTAGIRWVARPLQALVEHTERIGQGDFTTRTNLHTGDELDQLAQALNNMSTRLADQQATIARKTAEQISAVEQLRHADRLGTLGRMAAGIAHELGTPLNVVGGRAALIASGKLSPEEVVSSARTIKSEADRITNIVRQMLDFARQRPPQIGPCDLSQLIENTLSLVQTLAEKKQITLAFDDLRNSLNTEQRQCQVDAAQIQQVLTNLLVNALQSAPQQGQVKVTLDHPASQWVRIAVDDSGPGVPAELRQRIFEPFFTTKDVGEGTGLGLSIAYGIIEEHRGRIQLEDSSLGGARFEVWLPSQTKVAS